MADIDLPAGDLQRSQNLPSREPRSPQQVLVRRNLLTDLQQHQEQLDTYTEGFIDLVDVTGKCSELLAAIEAGLQDDSLKRQEGWRQIRKLIEESSNALARVPRTVASQFPGLNHAALREISGRATAVARSQRGANVEEISREMHRATEQVCNSVSDAYLECRRKVNDELRALSEIILRIIERADEAISQGGSEARVESGPGTRYQQGAEESRAVQGPGDTSRPTMADRWIGKR
jgi:hypothetical protein